MILCTASSKSVPYIQVYANTIIKLLYQVALTSVNHAELVALIKTHFDTLNDARQVCPENALPMPEGLQQAFVLLIMINKDENDHAITKQDIFAAFDQIEEGATLQIKEALAMYRRCDFKVLLEKGIQLCNARTNKNIVLAITTFDENCAPDFYVADGCDLRDANHSEYPKYQIAGRVPDDQQSAAYLRKLGICGPLMIQKIKGGEISIVEALKIGAENLQKLAAMLASPTLSSSIKLKLQIGGIQKYIFDGALTIEEAIKLPSSVCSLLNNDVIQHYFENAQLTLNQIMHLTSEQRRMICDPLIHQYIKYGFMTVERALALRLNEARNLNISWIKQSIYSGWMTLDQALMLTPSLQHIVSRFDVQQYISCYQLTYAQVSQLTEEHILFSGNDAEINKFFTEC